VDQPLEERLMKFWYLNFVCMIEFGVWCLGCFASGNMFVGFLNLVAFLLNALVVMYNISKGNW